MKGTKKARETVRDGFFCDLPEDLQRKVVDANNIISNTVDALLKDPAYTDLKSSSWAMTCLDDFRDSPTAKGEVGSVRVFKKRSKYECMIQATGHFTNHQYGWVEELLHDFMRDTFQTARTTIRKKHDLRLNDEGNSGQPYEGFDVYPSSKVAKQIWDLLEDRKTKAVTESVYDDIDISQNIIDYYGKYNNVSFDKFCDERLKGNMMESCALDEFLDFVNNRGSIYTEASNNSTPEEYNVDMTEAQAKRTLHSLSQNMMNNMAENKAYKVSQYTANIYANIITKNLLHKWANGYNKVSITLDSYQSFNTFEFRVPLMSQDFISRFINGREPINAFLHRIPEIKIKMSPRVFHTMKDPDDAFNFFKMAIKYYDHGIERYCKSLMNEAMKMNHNMKYLVSTSKLGAIITCPMQMLFVFDDVDISDKNTFTIDKGDISKVNTFFKNIYANYAAPEREKKKIIDDLKSLISVMKESTDSSNENMRSLSYLPEEVNKLYSGDYDRIIERSDNAFISENVDVWGMRNQKDPQVVYLQEKFGVKKLKKIPTDLIAYITIETDNIEDSNDKMMLASYTLGKIEVVEWYIELIDTQNRKYIVPHNKPYLESMRTQLLACYKRIMEVKIIKKKDRPLIDIQYPKGYEG